MENQNSVNKTIAERINGHIVACRAYSKAPYTEPGSKQFVDYDPKVDTGGLIHLNEVDNLTIIDLDINHSKDPKERMSDD